MGSGSVAIGHALATREDPYALTADEARGENNIADGGAENDAGKRAGGHSEMKMETTSEN